MGLFRCHGSGFNAPPSISSRTLRYLKDDGRLISERTRTRQVMKRLTLILMLFLQSLCWAQTADRVLDDILEEEWQQLQQERPLLAIYLGEKSSRIWPDNSRQARLRRRQHYAEVLSKLQEIEEAQLSPSQRVNRRLFQQQLEWQLASYDHKLDLFTMNQREGIHTLATLSSSIDFRTIEDLERWVKRLETFGDFTEAEISVLKEAMEEGRVQPRVITERMIELVAVQPELHAEPGKSPFYRPFSEADLALTQDPLFDHLARRARKAIKEEVRPAFQKLEVFMKGPYRSASPEKIGLGNLPGGSQAYQFLIQRYTTLDLSAEEIHQIGLREVARLRKEMKKITEEVGYQGTLEQFFDHLRSDKVHYTDNPQELLKRYRAFCKTVDGKMPNLFQTLPRKPYGVEAIPDYIAPATTTAYYLPGAGHLSGTYYVNLYKPETRALFEIPALSLHESVPGHHHQIALAQEMPDLPAFRRESAGFGDYTVFVEGWALYAESLGEEMGLYDDPYDLFGRYTYEMWRAIRLVLDTGIHTKGWSREKAIDYFLQNSPRSKLDVTNEVDRYISWPGQALAYKMGELELQKQRRRAEEELGSGFDIRTFHDAVLRQGAVPLDQLENQVTDYIESRKLDLSKAR